MRKALVVGIDDYPSSPLGGCVNDANSVKSVLETNGDGSPNFSVRLMTSPGIDIQKPTLREPLEELFYGESDIALFYFSGHGAINATGGYVVTTDARRYDEGISMDTILGLANQSKAKHKIILLDCCFSGNFGTPKIAGDSIAQLAEGLTVLTACRANETSLEVGGAGVFTALVVDALQGGAADLRGHITPGSIYAYVDQALGPWDQRPIFKTNVSTFSSLRTIAPQVPPIMLRKLADYFPSPEHHLSLNPTFEPTSESPDSVNIEIFAVLQKYVSVGLVVPVDAEHMYFAAIESKACRLTALGYQYWRLAKEKKI